MVGGPVSIPLVHETSRANAKTVAAVGVADFQYRSHDRLTFSNKKFEPPVRTFNHGAQRDWALPDRHLHRHSSPALSMRLWQWAHFDLACGYSGVCGAIVPPQHDIMIPIHGIVFGKGPPDA